MVLDLPGKFNYDNARGAAVLGVQFEVAASLFMSQPESDQARLRPITAMRTGLNRSNQVDR